MRTFSFFFFIFSVFWRFYINKNFYYSLISNRTFIRISSFFISRRFLSKRKINLGMSFFISDPNTLVYANYYSMRVFFLFFINIWNFRCNTLFISSFRTFKELVTYCISGFCIMYRFIWSFIFVDIDVSKRFLFTFENEYWITNSWDFANYFYQFWGLFFDAFYCCFFFSITYFLHFWKNLYGFYKHIYSWFFRICLYFRIFYFFSDESFQFDFQAFSIIRSFFELFIIFGNICKTIKSYI